MQTRFACIAITIPATDGVLDEYCDAPCEVDYCEKHEYLSDLADIEIESINPDNAYDLVNEQDWDLL